MKESYDKCGHKNKHHRSNSVEPVSLMGICKNSRKGCASVYFVGGEFHIFMLELIHK